MKNRLSTVKTNLKSSRLKQDSLSMLPYPPLIPQFTILISHPKISTDYFLQMKRKEKKKDKKEIKERRSRIRQKTLFAAAPARKKN